MPLKNKDSNEITWQDLSQTPMEDYNKFLGRVWSGETAWDGNIHRSMHTDKTLMATIKNRRICKTAQTMIEQQMGASACR